jgi:hypothetical protein
MNMLAGNLHIKSNSQLCWYANSKGTPLNDVSGDVDVPDGIRSTSLTTGPTDIGADEFITTTIPPSTFGYGCNSHLFSAVIINGAIYQWQEDTGTGFANISENSVYQGTKTAILYVHNVPYSWNGYKYRCIITNGNASETTVPQPLKFLNLWTGAVSNEWNNAANWSCNIIPNENIDVVIDSGVTNHPYITTNTIVKSLKVHAGVSVTVASGVTLTILY